MVVRAERLIDFIFDADPQPVVIRERCIVANVTQPLLSLGRLMRKGWWPINDGNGAGGDHDSMMLKHAQSGAQIPLMFKGYSLAVHAQIRRVDAVQDDNADEANKTQWEVPTVVQVSAIPSSGGA